MLDPRDLALFADAAIAFDLDGTLVDTAPDLLRALNAVIQPRGLEAVELDAVRAMVGRGARALLERAHAAQSRTLADPDDAVAEFIEIYKADVAAHSRPFDGVEETLAWLKAQGSGYGRAALVGDSEPDVASAAAAGLPSIVMSYGYSERPADSLGAGRVIHAFSDVPLALAELWRGTT